MLSKDIHDFLFFFGMGEEVAVELLTNGFAKCYQHCFGGGGVWGGANGALNWLATATLEAC